MGVTEDVLRSISVEVSVSFWKHCGNAERDALVALRSTAEEKLPAILCLIFAPR